MEPLAYALRPKTIDEIVGQQHLVGPNGVIRRLLAIKKIPSLVFFGDPGIGKTTLAKVIVNELKLQYDTFNASSDNKEKLKKLIQVDNNQVLIIDEIHRMKKDIQDFLLPFVESGEITIIGLTTINPYRSLNPAVRSRTNIYKLFPLSSNDLTKLIDKGIDYINQEIPSENISNEEKFSLDEKAKKYLAEIASGEGRSLLNMVESLFFAYGYVQVTFEMAKDIVLKPSLEFDKNGDGYYNTLSGLHKSIRGSDVNASLHYLGKLLYVDDLLPLVRRLYCIAYEDISLANPNIGPRVRAACETALDLGMPEARIPLASIVVEMALSPKSNSTYLAISKALEDIETKDTGTLPPHLKNVYSFEEGNGKYLYPHDYPGGWVNQQYLPDKIKDAIYYVPKTTSKYEEALKERYEAINKAKEKYKK